MVAWKLIGGLMLAAAAIAGMGVGMYYVGLGDGRAEAEQPKEPKQDVYQKLQDEIKSSNIDQYLKQLTSVPHLAGTEQDLEQAEWVRSKFQEFGFDEATVVPYEVLLSYPKWDKPNKVYLLNSATGGVVFETSGTQTPIYAPEESSPQVAPNFNAYSAPGTVQGDVVYAYYGRDEDYQVLTKAGINVAGKIVLARYGAIFRGNIVAIAEKHGAIGVILFSDPKDFAQGGRNFVYADSWWMPGMAVQSGTVYDGNGDPLTPFYPSLDSAYRIDQSKADLPKIPVQPIGYDEAEVLLRAMKGPAAPDAWQGNLNTTYHLDMNNAELRVKLEVHTSNKMATIHNTIGVIRGEEEPDRYVLVGNHRDAWTLGALDPSSGTACMLEMARAFGVVMKELNWRPRRSIVFCSWGAEEYGLIGSYEWVEEHAKMLSQRAVAYLNVDIAVSGNYSLRGLGHPLMRRVMVDSSKRVANPNPSQVAAGRPTLFETWAAVYPDGSHPGEPSVRALGSGSDYTAFSHIVGIPSLDFRYIYQENVQSYPLYHTLYETHHLAGYLIDQGFVHHRAVAQLWAEVARNLTESDLLPFDVQWYATYLNKALTDLQTRYSTQMSQAGVYFDKFETAVSRFANHSRTFVAKLNSIDARNWMATREVNDKLMLLDRHFIDPRGLPNRPEYNHVIFSPSSSNTYASATFAGLTDLLETLGAQSEGDKPVTWAQVKQHLSVITFLVEAAAKSLTGNF